MASMAGVLAACSVVCPWSCVSVTSARPSISTNTTAPVILISLWVSHGTINKYSKLLKYDHYGMETTKYNHPYVSRITKIPPTDLSLYYACSHDHVKR